MVKVPVVWVQCYHGGGNPDYVKVAGEPVFIIGEEGENVLMVTRPERVFVPIFEASSTEDGANRGFILERMLAVAECCVIETGKVGTVYGIFRNYSLIQGSGGSVHVTEVGLLCTASEFNPSDERVSQEDCERLGLPWEIEIEDQVVENHGTRA